MSTTVDPVPVEVPVIAITPEEVIGPPETDNQVGTDTSIEVTVPLVAGADQKREEPLEVRICPSVPIEVKPVPPSTGAIGVPDMVRASVPVEVIGEPDTVKYDGAVRATEETVPVEIDDH